MSHSKERAEKVCLNCGADLVGRYCHKCGQENTEPQQTVWHFIVHFFNDFTHFDGKFFHTIKLLLSKPGFLSAEYKNGRRADYLDPARMYIFTSAITFLLFFTIGPGAINGTTDVSVNGRSLIKKEEVGRRAMEAGNALQKYGEEIAKDTTFRSRTVEQYDSLQNALPPSERDSWIVQLLQRKSLSASSKIDESVSDEHAGKEIWGKFIHSFPQLFFISLPFFTAILYLLNIRRRKEYYFVSHAIFAIHVYCAVYIMGIICLLLFYVPLLGLMSIPVFLIWPLIYLYLAMRRFYQQGWFKTLMKFLILNVLSLIIIVFLFIIYLFNSFLSVADSV